MHADTFLSTSVRTLLHCASTTALSKDMSNEYLTTRYTFNWDNIGFLLKGNTGHQEPSDLAQMSKSWFIDTITALVPVFDAAEQLCQKAATSDVNARSRLFDLWKWTDSADEMFKCLEESFGPFPKQTSAVESMLIVSAILERAIGNVLRRRNLAVPFLLRDLLLERTLYHTFGEEPVQFTRLLVGMPSALNARNLVWHGFVAPNELPSRIPATLLILLASLGEILLTDDEPVFKTEPQLLVIEELPEAPTSDFDEFRSLVPCLLPPQFLAYWECAFQRYSEQQFGRCLVLLLPQLELLLRIGFCICNECPRRLLTAVQSSPHTTLDDMLVETVHGKPNILCKELGEGLLNALFDLLQRPSGPRIRDRLGHGEYAMQRVPRNCAALSISLSLAIAARLSKHPFSQMSFWDDYKARFHPAVFFQRQSLDVLKQIEKVDRALHRASDFIDSEKENFDLVDSLEKALTDGDCMETALVNLNIQPATLFRPRQEIIATVALLRTVRSLCLALEYTRLEMDKRSSEATEGRLRSRQRKTLQRMIQITPSVTKVSTCLVIMAVRIRNTVAQNPDDFEKWHRCLWQMEKYTEKLASYAHGTKNRWEEVRTLTSTFCDTILPFFT